MLIDPQFLKVMIFNENILLVGINASVAPDPGFAKEIVVPIPTPAVGS